MKDKLTSRKRFFKALNLQKPDKVPTFDFLFSPVIWRKILGIEPKYTAKEQLAAALILGLDSVSIPTRPASSYKFEIKDGIYKDEWGGIMKKDPASWPIDAPYEFIIKDRNDLKSLNRPDPNSTERYEEQTEVVRLNKGRAALGGVVEGPLVKAWVYHGAGKLMRNFYDDPKFIIEMFKVFNDFAIPYAVNQVKAGLDYMWVAEDLGYSSGPFFSKKMFKELLYPFLLEIITELRKEKEDLKIAFHCCGDFKIFIEDIIDLGVNAINPFQRTAGWDISQVKQEYGDRIAIIGNIDSSRTLPYGTTEDVKNEVKETIEAAGQNGGLVIASDHSLHDGIPVENMLAIYEAVEEFGYY